jgi:hypothetical protein
MKTSRQQVRLYLLLAWLCIPLSWPASSQQADKAEAPIDVDVYEELMAREVTDFVDLEIVLRGERAPYEIMTPPASDFILRQPIDHVLPFSWEGFSKDLPGILGDRYEYEYSVPVYKLRAVEDRATRQLIFYGKDDEALFALDQPMEYDPFARLKSQYPGLYSGRYSAAEVKAFEAACDPARVELMVTLIPTEYVEPYLYAQAKVVEYQLSLMEEPGDGGLMMMSMSADSNIVITSLMKLTNGLQLEIGYPEIFTNRLDIYRATDVMERDWQLISAPQETTGTISVVWLDTEPGGYRAGFYAVGNHDLDGDGDGFSDAFEILVLGTDPHDPDSCGVYLSGEILYAGPESGRIYVQAVTESADSWSKTWQTGLSAPGPYTNLVANQLSYWFKSFMDVNGNQQHDEWEPWGIYSANAMPATNDITDLDITLADQPSIWGTLDYSGGATGDIHVLATPVPSWDTTYSTVIPWVQGSASLTGDTTYVSFPVDYSITGLPPGDYFVRAFIDEDGNGVYTHLEKGGQYAVETVSIGNRVTGINIGIGLDTDADGIPDWWEMEHFGGATNALPSADSDSDGLDNLSEYQAGTDPDNSDTDDDGLGDGEEVDVFNTNPASWDSDGDGVSDGSEVDQGYDPNDPDDTPEAEWFVVTGDLDEDIPKIRTRTVTIPDGEQRALIVAIFSEEYPHYTGQASQFNDTLEWNIVPSAGSPIADSVDVNNRHTQWDEQGTNLLGFDPAYIEESQIIAAPLDAPLTLTITLSAMNIGDGVLPSTVMVGLPVLKIDMITPAGDPVNSPVQSGDGQNEFTYSTANPGVLTMNLKARVTPSGIANQIKDQVHFTVDGIGSSTLAWGAANPGGKPTASGDDLLATVTFTGLPVNNSDFGAKKAAVYFNGNKQDEEDYEVFFPRDASNNASGDPNWFYYWNQIAGIANLVYAGSSGGSTMAEVRGMTQWSYTVAPNKTTMFVYDQVVTKTMPYGVGKEMSGIDMFVGTAIHENQHVIQIGSADALLPTSGTDSFRYGWSWNQAPHNHWQKGPDGQWGVAVVDDDGNGIVDDAQAVPPFEPGYGDDISLDHSSYIWWPAAWPLPNPNNVWHPIESDAVNATDNAMNAHDHALQDWGSPGKQHDTLNKWDD